MMATVPRREQSDEMTAPGVLAALARDRPGFHAGGGTTWSASAATLGALHELTGAGARTLETGCGASTVVFAARGAIHTAISPSEHEHERVRDYCRQIGVDDRRVTFLAGSSDALLPALPDARDLELAFIDGAHSFPYPVIDWHYVSRRLKTGGRLLLDDIPMPSITALFRFMRDEPNWRLDEIIDHRAALFTLLAPPPQEGEAIQVTNRRSDYSFAPLPARALLSAGDRLSRMRYAGSQRFPHARRAWRRVAGPRR